MPLPEQAHGPVDRQGGVQVVGFLLRQRRRSSEGG
jgi:hypothetical protein